ncbi:MAG: FAD-binding oxidoreductase [Halieaceae bacterium]|nr:FAD-binding oxidoreductase [Halieaceae bacterium]
MLAAHPVTHALKAALGEQAVKAEESDLAPYLEDERGLYQGSAACLVFPATTGEVAEVVKLCIEHDCSLVPQGGNTGYCGGATPSGESQVLLNLSRLNRIRAIDPVGMTATAEAGVILANLHNAVEAEELFFPLSMGSEGSCQLGGNLATNAGGLAVLKYGMAGELVLGLEVVLPDGSVLNTLKPLRKDNTGYHLKQLFLGAEGTLGIITAAVLKLFPRPTEFQTAWLAVSDIDAACQLLPAARRASGDSVTSFEYISGESLALLTQHVDGLRPPLPGEHHVLLELSGALPPGSLRPQLEQLLEQALEAGWAQDAVIAESLEQRRGLWALRENIPEAEKRAGRSIKHDVSVPIADIPAYCAAAPGRLEALGPLRLSIYGHIGDGNLHYNVLAPEGTNPQAFRAEKAEAISRVVHDLAAEMGGSFSAEHGIGQLKTGELARYGDPAALEMMRALKAAIDPAGRMNPGKLLD